MFRPVRTLVSLAFLALMVWAAFALPLGGRTLAEHVDRIGETSEAQDLVDGTRSTINPVIEEAKDRVLGEYVEAPTQINAATAEEAAPAEPKRSGRLPRP